jgi:DNA-binding transcriptional ArsR family regulator
VDGKKRERGAPERKWKKVRPRRLRIRIVAVAHLRDVTPKEFAIEEGLAPSTVKHHFNVLEQDGWIRLCRVERVGNVVRNWYTADRLKIISDGEFEQMNEQQRSETSEGVLKNYIRICRLSWKEGTLDARPDSQLSQILMYLDKKGWKDVQETLDVCLEKVLELRVEAEMRLRESGEEPDPTVVHLGGFEVPRAAMEGAHVTR